MVIYIKNNARNRRILARLARGTYDASPCGKATNVHQFSFDGEEIEAYHWKGNLEEFNLNCCYRDVLLQFLKHAGIRRWQESRACSRIDKYRNTAGNANR